MKALKFTLSGETAFFKKPDVNSYYYFTYGNIHKIALLGVLGAVIGLSGYNAQGKEDDYPEFYKKLKDIEIAIIPNNNKGIITKKMQVFNNSVGYASEEAGGNLIVKEQWLEKPSWDILISSENNEYYEILVDRLTNMRCEYIPYLGKNDHFANITQVEILEGQHNKDVQKIHSLILKNNIEKIEKKRNRRAPSIELWKYEERLPIELEKVANQYITKSFVFTNMNIKLKEDAIIYTINNKNIFFF